MSLIAEERRAAIDRKNYNNNKGLCQECREREVLYQCPRCAVRTCSLNCCRAHKGRTGCTGKRDPTAFLAVANMTDQTLASDFYFLEDGAGRVDAGKRLLRTTAGGGGSDPYHLPHHSKRPRRHEETVDERQEELPSSQHPMFRAAADSSFAKKVTVLRNNGGPRNYFQTRAAALGGVSVLVLPSAMERHKGNTSSVRKDVLHWTVEWSWCCDRAGDEMGAIIDGETTTTTTMTSTTTRKPASRQTTTTTIVHNVPETSVVWELLPTTQSARQLRPSDYSVLLKKLPCPSNQPVYMEISPTATLADALRDMTVVEFPTFYIVPANRLADFPRAIEEVIRHEE